MEFGNVLLSIALVLCSDEAGGGCESHDSSREMHLECIGFRSFKLKYYYGKDSDSEDDPEASDGYNLREKENWRRP